MRLLEGQLSLFDMVDDEVDEDDDLFPIAEFDRRFKNGSRFRNGSNIVEITNIRIGEQNAEIKNVTLEMKKMYVGARYYINKESYGKWYTAVDGSGYAENGNIKPCPYTKQCRTYLIGCKGETWWCGKEGFKW